MTDKEKIEAYIANCKCCTLAQAMKTCPSCLFNIGLAEKINLADFIPQPAPQIMQFALSG